MKATVLVAVVFVLLCVEIANAQLFGIRGQRSRWTMRGEAANLYAAGVGRQGTNNVIAYPPQYGQPQQPYYQPPVQQPAYYPYYQFDAYTNYYSQYWR